MSETTPNMGMPYILPAQAQKHVIHNEALQIIDGIANIVVRDSLSVPPTTPAEGDVYLVLTALSGEWLGRAGRLAMWIDGAWLYITPRDGWCAWFCAESLFKVFDGSTWVNPLSTEIVDRLGISATPDDTNRLAVSSPASLLSHAGGGHRMIINKAATADTASILFQTGWAGRAEIGTAGSDRLQFKASADGAAWVTALEMDGGGVVRTPARPVASARLTESAFTASTGDQIGVDTLTISQGGVSLGAALASGHGRSIIVPADGLYSVSIGIEASTASGFSVAASVNGSVRDLKVTSAGAVAASLGFQASGILALNASDALCLACNGPATIADAGVTISMHLI